jgi:hypothetical protein
MATEIFPEEVRSFDTVCTFPIIACFSFTVIRKMLDRIGAIPGAAPVGCGNRSEQNLDMDKWKAAW